MQIRKTNPYLESAILLVLIAAAGFVLYPQDPFWTRFPASPYWLIVLMIPLRYGSPYGLVVSAGCALLQLVAYSGFSYDTLRSDVFLHPHCLLLPGAFLIAGHFIGEAVYASFKRNEFHAQEMQKLQADKERLYSEFAALEQSYRQVEGQVAGESDSLYALLRSLPALDTVQPFALPKAVESLLRRFIKANQFAYWKKLNGNWRQIYPQESSVPLPSLGTVALREKRIVTAKEYPSAAEGDSFEIAGVFTLNEGAETHLLAAGNIQFIFWHKRMERIFSAILREVRLAQGRFLHQGILDYQTPFEQHWKLSGETFMRQHVENEVRLQHRAGGTSALLFLAPQSPMQHDSNLLTILASVLRNLLRTSDTKAYLRDNGFFVAFLPKTNHAGAENAAQKVLSALEALHLTYANAEIRYQVLVREVGTLEELNAIKADLQEGKLL